MEIRSLAGVDLETLTNTFNHSFSDYVVPIQFDTAYKKIRMQRSRVNLDLSVGTFAGKELVGFMLFGQDQWNGKSTTYNSGTGVIPPFRGRRLVQKMYDWIIPKWRQTGIAHTRLEVIQGNDKAIRAYTKVGLQVNRELWSWQAPESSSPSTSLPSPHLAKMPDWESYTDLLPYQPAWDAMSAGIQATLSDMHCYEWRKAEELHAFAILNQRGQIFQAGCLDSYTLPSFISHLQQLAPNVSWINLPASSAITTNLTASHWQTTIKQFEMGMDL